MPKYQAVFEALQREILEGKYSRGRRLPSEAELVLRHKISRPTAARALRELQQMGVITRRAGSGSFLREPQKGDKRVRSGLTFGLLVPGLGSTEILDPICNEITRFAQSLESEVLWGDAAAPVATAEDALALCRMYVERHVDGVFFAPVERIHEREACNHAITSMLSNAGIAVVLLDRDATEFPQRSEFDLIGIDNLSAGIALTEHLLAAGSSRVCFLGRPLHPSTTTLRRMGCEEALRRAGISGYPVEHIGQPDDLAFVRGMLKRAGPDAIICSNDQVAAVLLQSLGSLGIRVPDSVRVAGFDDVRYATLLAVPLTTMRQPCRELGRVAVQTLSQRIADASIPARQILLEAKLMPRASTT